jgi:hypothetical protein
MADGLQGDFNPFAFLQQFAEEMILIEESFRLLFLADR